MVARDAGSPQKTSDVATVTIEVIRNENSPKFEKDRYTATINQNEGSGKRIVQVRADDKDEKVMTRSASCLQHAADDHYCDSHNSSKDVGRSYHWPIEVRCLLIIRLQLADGEKS